YLRSATCATRPKGPRGPTVGYGPPDNLSHWHRCQWQRREIFRAQPPPAEAVRVGSLQAGVGHYQLLRLTLERKHAIIRQLDRNGEKIAGKTAGAPGGPQPL